MAATPQAVTVNCKYDTLLQVRYHLSGVLTLHTLCSQSMLSIVVTCQTVIGSVFIALGGLAGYLAGKSGAAVTELRSRSRKWSRGHLESNF